MLRRFSVTPYLGIEVGGTDDGPVGHGEGIAWTFGHLHAAGGHDGVGVGGGVGVVVNLDLKSG
jgi:hypothetical protein